MLRSQSVEKTFEHKLETVKSDLESRSSGLNMQIHKIQDTCDASYGLLQRQV